MECHGKMMEEGGGEEEQEGRTKGRFKQGGEDGLEGLERNRKWRGERKGGWGGGTVCRKRRCTTTYSLEMQGAPFQTTGIQALANNQCPEIAAILLDLISKYSLENDTVKL
jgi:hypothetical protein